jgi:hypothetical protein
MKILNSTTSFSSIDLTTAGGVSLGTDADGLAGTEISIGKARQFRAQVAVRITAGETLTVRFIQRAVVANEEWILQEVTATAESVNGLAIAVSDILIQVGIGGQTKIKVEVESSDTGATSESLAAYLFDVDGLDDNGRVDVGQTLGGTPPQVSDIATAILDNPSNPITSDVNGRVPSSNIGGGVVQQ